MSVHVKIGKLSLCQMGPISRLVGGVSALSKLLHHGPQPVCGHATHAEAKALVEVLRAHGHAARVVEGECDQQGDGGPI
jgi:hypothetical protein